MGIRIIANFRRIERRIQTAVKQAVSKTRRRYQKDGFNLDITYITPRVIAMSVPAIGAETIYRNPIDQVVQFFETKHHGHYRIYNCCPEKKYPYEKFNNQVCEFFMEDHNPTTIEEIIKFCHNLSNY